MLPNRYALRHGLARAGDFLQSWNLEGRNDESEDWALLRAHVQDTGIPRARYGVGCWPVERLPKGRGFRYLRIRMTGTNTGGTGHLNCCGLEFWGRLTDTAPA